MQHQYYHFSDELDLKENFFLTKIYQKYQAHKYIKQDENVCAYFTVRETQMILGCSTYKNRIIKMINLGLVKKVLFGNNKFGDRLYGYIPIVNTFKKLNTNNKIVNSYYQRKHSSLSKGAKSVFKTISRSEVCITMDEFFSCVKEAYMDYKLKNSSPLSEEEYTEGMVSLWESICEFNGMNKTEKVEYVTEDDFGNRLHSIFTRLPKAIRKGYVKINGEKTVEIDLAQSQPTLLANVLEKRLGENSFTTAIKEGNDIYLMLNENRGKGKKEMFYLLFGKRVSSKFARLFPDVVDEIKRIKNTKISKNPSKKVYSNLAFLLQQEESRVFRELWGILKKSKVEFIPIHDSIMVKTTDLNKATNLMSMYLYTKLYNCNITIGL